ncbi:FHA domain-containing protein [Pseudomonas fontis]|uniref:FHA domain-containing protein n=1 Tax=Pseudomonas fontis TaxID=2942633 RepID=A0ABT5P0R1_9PSED|nr:FHA domain-containing protein [Pseudomonas fontis]MDD0972921.1 FHA domain-containing protein [Pseudomonas fontis]MDD0993903.1 FHA domain-containing protein [Pseudomonas fontis]
MNRLALTVCNPEQLQHGMDGSHQFDRRGGTIGSQHTGWLLQDRDLRVQALHCQIHWAEGSFCVIDRCTRTYLNGHQLSLDAATPVRLKDGDVLSVGAYRLQAHLLLDDGKPHFSRRSLVELLHPHDGVLDALLAELPAEALPAPDGHVSHPSFELDQLLAGEESRDPLTALDALASPQQVDDHWVFSTILPEHS